ncbi:MAG: hypothetical protein LBD01_02435, partial [Puniceicoccales bacterium]|nr:hypothetical protein [Puniceicoccales bacterium]
MNKKIASLAAVCALWIGLASPIFASDGTSRGQFIPLWSGQAPGETAPEKPEISETDPKTGIKWIAQ